jgi:hypothetical protein
MGEQSEQQKFAVLIDGDNAQPALLNQILAEVSRVGLATIKRIYGDWTTTNMNSWKNELHRNAIQPIQQFRYTVGKNATDSAMIIDAMDLLHSRVEGLFVIGVGEKKTPEAFTNACNQFIYCENLVGIKAKGKKAKKGEESDVSDPRPLLLQGFEMAAKEEEWVQLSLMGHFLRKLNPAFDPRTFGHKQLQSLIKDYPETFVLKLDDSKTPPVAYIALKANQ